MEFILFFAIRISGKALLSVPANTSKDLPRQDPLRLGKGPSGGTRVAQWRFSKVSQELSNLVRKIGVLGLKGVFKVSQEGLRDHHFLQPISIGDMAVKGNSTSKAN
jgi:hypothetical protein